MTESEASTQTTGTPLGDSYSRLSGEHLLSRLLEDGRLHTLEAFWRFGDAQLASQVANQMGEAADEGLANLLLIEVLEGDYAQPVPAQLIRVIDRFTPPLAPNDTDVLIDRLNGSEPLRGPRS